MLVKFTGLAGNHATNWLIEVRNLVRPTAPRSASCFWDRTRAAPCHQLKRPDSATDRNVRSHGQWFALPDSTIGDQERKIVLMLARRVAGRIQFSRDNSTRARD